MSAEIKKIMAFIPQVKLRASLRAMEVDGFVMYANTASLEREITVGPNIGEFFSIAEDLSGSLSYPRLMVWEGTIEMAEDGDDYSCIGVWRPATDAEALDAAKGINPFAPVPTLEAAK